jgi:hypothetical protein
MAFACLKSCILIWVLTGFKELANWNKERWSLISSLTKNTSDEVFFVFDGFKIWFELADFRFAKQLLMQGNYLRN